MPSTSDRKPETPAVNEIETDNAGVDHAELDRYIAKLREVLDIMARGGQHVPITEADGGAPTNEARSAA